MKYLIFSLLLLFSCNKKVTEVVKQQAFEDDHGLFYTIPDSFNYEFITYRESPEFEYLYQYEIVPTKNDTINIKCEERGHVLLNNSVTLMNISTRIKDTDSTRIMIYTNPNLERGNCSICGEYIERPVQEYSDTTILWKAN